MPEQNKLDDNIVKTQQSSTELEMPKDPRRLTNINWSKDTPRTAKEWKALSSIEQLDWSIWHEIRLQHIFATVAILLEIIAAIVTIILTDSSVGMSILICLAALILAVITGAFSSVLYRVLRAAVGGGLIGFVVSIILMGTMDEGTLRMVLIILGYAGGLALIGSMEAKGEIGQKVPHFPGPKEPSLLDDMKKLRQEWKKAAAKRPKGEGYGAWFKNTTNAWKNDGIINSDLHKY